LILDLSGEPIELGDADGVLMRQLLGNSRALSRKMAMTVFMPFGRVHYRLVTQFR
jgi:hypothetical protein